jgi:hypothetical protein
MNWTDLFKRKGRAHMGSPFFNGSSNIIKSDGEVFKKAYEEKRGKS